MCTGAEIPATIAAAAGTAAAGSGAAAGTAAGLGAAGTAGAGLDAILSAAPELAAGQAALSTSAVPGLLSATPSSILPELGDVAAGPTFGASSTGGMLDAGGSELAGAPQAANPFSIGLGNFQNSSFGQGLNRGMDAYSNMQKAQTLSNMGRPQNTTMNVQRPPSMNQQQPQTPFAQQFGPHAGMQGGPDAAKLMILKRMGLLGGM